MQETQTQERPHPQPPHQTGASPSFEPLSGYVETPAADGGPTFGPLEAEAPAPAVTPFTPSEIADGTMLAVMIGLERRVLGRGPLIKFADQAEAQKFADEFKVVTDMTPVPITTIMLIERLRIGEAMAEYGFGHGMAIERVLERGEELPGWARILAYLVGIGIISAKAAKAVIDGRLEPYQSGGGGGLNSGPAPAAEE